MEWKEHVAWLVPFIATAIAVVAWRYRERIIADKRLRLWLTGFFVACFVASLIPAGLGGAITKVAPNDFLFVGG